MSVSQSMRAIRLVNRHHSKDWKRVKALHERNVEHADIEKAREGYAHNLTEKGRLGERISLWANLIAIAAGVDADRQPSDDEAEAILLGWAVEQAMLRGSGNAALWGEGSRSQAGGEPAPENPPTSELTYIDTTEAGERWELNNELGRRLLSGVHRECGSSKACVIHKPTNHPMREFPLHYRADRNIFERICPHGVGHPDPDQIDYWRDTDQEHQAIHGCDLCCGVD